VVPHPRHQDLKIGEIHLAFLLAPFVAYLAAGVTKLIINSIRAGRLSIEQIGLGGIPSTHNTITATMTWLIAMRTGIDTAVFGVALTLMLIVAIDALDLRRKVGSHAAIIRRLHSSDPEAAELRTKVGHSIIEVCAGWLLGLLCALVAAGL
jgi:acid phosphatase family membrane protein YuiD